MSLKHVVSIIALACMSLTVVGCDGGKDAANNPSGATPAKAEAGGRCPHEIKQEMCPFCNPQLVESDGFCGEHGVAEALCYLCRPYLNAAFRAKGDWCAEHNAPESQCIVCHPEIKDKMTPGGHGVQTPPAAAAAPTAAGNCEHGIALAKCPFCTPSLIETDGFCKAHNIAEALCVKCRSYLETAFKAKGDWCAEHATPESQCAICNPQLKNLTGAPSAAPVPGGGPG